MCRTIEITTFLEEEDVKNLMKKYNIEGRFGWYKQSDVYYVEIDGIDDRCFCDVNNEQKLRIYEFAYELSIVS